VEDNLHLFKCNHRGQKDIIARMKDRIMQENKQEPQSSIAKTIVEGMLSGIKSSIWQKEATTNQEKCNRLATHSLWKDGERTHRNDIK
jgi:hypothetical protein